MSDDLDENKTQNGWKSNASSDAIEDQIFHFLIQGAFKCKGTKCRNNITVNIFANAAVGERNQTSRDTVGIRMDQSMPVQPHVKEGEEALMKSAVQLMWHIVWGQDGVHTFATEEQRGVFRFPTEEGVQPAAIEYWMVNVYGEDCVSGKSVRKWSARHESLVHDPRLG